MLDYPLPIPRNTLYEQMGLRPEASDTEIREAKDKMTAQLRQQEQAVSEELEKVYAQVPGLKEAYAERKAIQDHGKSAASEARRQAHQRVAELERKALHLNPRFKELSEQAVNLEAKIYQINGTPLEKPDLRATYDATHPPLGLLKLAPPHRNPFGDNKTALALLRQELARFLAAHNVAVFHPSDLTREDFTADFTFNPKLDLPSNEQQRPER